MKAYEYGQVCQTKQSPIAVRNTWNICPKRAKDKIDVINRSHTIIVAFHVVADIDDTAVFDSANVAAFVKFVVARNNQPCK
jgi:hypothetical protein